MSERFFIVSPDELKAERIMLSPNEAAHALRVLRLGVGHEVWLIDGVGGRAKAVIERTTPMLCRVIERPIWQPPGPAIVMAIGISKNPAMDLMAQKLAELMVDEVRPFSARRSVSEPGSQKHERWGRISMQALKQCRCPRAPRYLPACTMENVLKSAPENALKLIAWEEETSLALTRALPAQRPQQVWAIIGPEGGLDQDEVALAKEYGFVSCRLTSSILRAETAALTMASVLRCHWPE